MLSQRKIAGTTLKCSQVVFGTADWTSRKGDDLDELYTTFREAGGNCFDSAHCYAFWLDSLGAPERALGELVRKHDDRENVIICSKGCHLSGGEKYPRPERYMTPELLNADLHESLDRLEMDTIDLYYLHRDDPKVPVDEILDALHAQQQAGRIRYYAASNWFTPRLDAANAYARKKGYQGFVASQVLYNLAQLAEPLSWDICVVDAEQENWYAQHQLPVFAYSATANGYFSNAAPRWANYATPVSEARRQRCVELGERFNASPSAIALAYLMHQPFPVFPITGTLKLEHLQDAVRAAAIHLSEKELCWLKDGA